ncbi:MAG: exosortase A [Gammaproteobacteria bacterium]
MLNIASIPIQWKRSLLLLCIIILGIIGAFYSTWASMAAIWYRSETFAHGFLVMPISLWLIWMRREHYGGMCPLFSYYALIALIGFGFVWLVADLVDVLVVRQWAVVGVLVSSIWAVLGNRVTLQMLFPLMFLFLMVPFGEEFIPWLMDYTATFVVTMLRLTGISVYREGTFLTLTSGQWSVVEGCSGLRYLIASITLGTVYAYLNYTSYVKRSIFMVASFLLPILANGMRAYMIVMIGHLSDMKLATGVDHVIYGWVFFGLVMLVLFYIGSFWHDPPEKQQVLPEASTSSYCEYPSLTRVLPIMILCLSVWPLTADALHQKQVVKAKIPIDLVSSVSTADITIEPTWGWRPEFKGVMADSRYFISDEGTVIGAYLANFGDESGGGELVNSQNYLVPQKHKVWRITHNDKIQMEWPEQSVQIDESLLNSQSHDLLVWRWYRVGKTNTANDYYAKWLQLIKRLSGDTAAELLIVLYTETPHDDYGSARDRLKRIALACCG